MGMENKTDLKKTEALLLRSLDEPLTAVEKQQLEEALQTEPGLQATKADYLLIRSELSTLAVAPSSGFVRRVVAATQEKNQITTQIIQLWPAVAAAAVVAIVLGVGWVYGTSGSLEVEAIYGLDQLAIEDVFALDY